MRRAALLVAVVAGVLLALLGALRAGWGAADPAEAKARNATPPSRFITVDGVPLHYRDEGQGPVLLLLHGSIVNLHEWDLVVDRLKDRFRLVRLDWPPYGVSGPDPKGVYSTPRAAELVAGFVAALDLPPFTLVSTSNGANVALEYASRQPERLEAMAFSILPLERPSQTRHVAWPMKWLSKFHARFLPDWRSRTFWRLVLETTTPPGFSPTAAMVDPIYWANNQPGALERQRQYIAANTLAFKTSDVGAVAGTVRVPVLLQWCGYDTVISQGAAPTVSRFTSTTVTLLEYPEVGHFPMWEIPERFSEDLAAWVLSRQAAPTLAGSLAADTPTARP
jgi:pimeloyl-ACP methyl ester carboxylesterase